MRKILSRDNIFLAVAMAAVSSGCKDVPVPPAPVTVATLPPPPRGMPTSDDSTSNPALIVVDEPLRPTTVPSFGRRHSSAPSGPNPFGPHQLLHGPNARLNSSAGR